MKTGSILAFLFSAVLAFSWQAGAETEKKILYWTDPMIPGFKSDKPGKSPMGMEMVPVYEESESGQEVKISKQSEINSGLRTEKAVVRKISRKIRAAGSVTYDERKVANIQSKVGGWVEKLYVDFTGQKVKKNEYLLEIYSPDLVATEEEFLLAIKNRDTARKSADPEMRNMGEGMYEATRKRLEYFDVPEHQIKELEKTRVVFKTLHLHSPFNGVVVSKQVFVGAQVGPGMTLYTVADLSTVWVQADVYEYEIGWVKEGDEAKIALPAFPGKKFKGRVLYINPFLEKDTRTVRVRMELLNPGMDLKPDMFASAEILTRPHMSVAVPIEAVIRGGERNIVIVSKGNGAFEPREVRLGIEGDKYVQIVEGVRQGELVVTSAQFLIDSESNLKEVVGKMLSGREGGSASPDSGGK